MQEVTKRLSQIRPMTEEERQALFAQQMSQMGIQTEEPAPVVEEEPAAAEKTANASIEERKGTAEEPELLALRLAELLHAAPGNLAVVAQRPRDLLAQPADLTREALGLPRESLTRKRVEPLDVRPRRDPPAQRHQQRHRQAAQQAAADRA